MSQRDFQFLFRDPNQGIKTDLFAIERYVDEVHREVEGKQTFKF